MWWVEGRTAAIPCASSPSPISIRRTGGSLPSFINRRTVVSVSPQACLTSTGYVGTRSAALPLSLQASQWGGGGGGGGGGGQRRGRQHLWQCRQVLAHPGALVSDERYPMMTPRRSCPDVFGRLVCQMDVSITTCDTPQSPHQHTSSHQLTQNTQAGTLIWRGEAKKKR